ncbi:hypothetical protein ACHAW5_003825 [Stephanodiscus triporus]|uniref:Tafazzin family protein n=1 Tax=Stephanodiscus triporus TaxID=2934178 RepID=A0ABD3QZM7_9STRA
MVLRLGRGDDDDDCDDDEDDGQGRPRRHHRRWELITVSNHRSLFNDPGVLSCLLPLPITKQPRYNRWALCSQEYCFNGALPGLIRGYIGAGQGGVWQWTTRGGRCLRTPSASLSDFGRGNGSGPNDDDDNNNDDDDDGAMRIIPATARQRALPLSPVGKLKWGVSKLIAHAPIMLVVIPFAHHGMERLLPQDEDRLHVTVRFGKEISFDDLILEHKSRHGKLWKYSGKVEDDEE